MSHPSSLTLDRVALGLGAPAEVEHVAACAQCRAHVERSRPTTEPLPAWATPGRPWWWGPLRWALAVTVAAGLAALVWVRQPRAAEEDGTVRVKGLPAFAIYVAAEARSPSLWDGRQPVPVGARLQGRVNGAGFSYVVVGLERGGRWEVLHEGPLAATGETTLPASWLVDAEDPLLKLGFLLCQGRCGGDELAEAARARPRDARRWWTGFDVPVGGAR